MKKDAVIAKLRQALPGLRSRYPIHDIALFGSVARGEESTGSDVDLLVDVDPDIGLAFVDLADELERILGTPVDVLTPRSLNPKAKDRLVRDLVHVR